MSDKKEKWVSGFLLFIGEDGKPYKGEVVRVSDFKFDGTTFSGHIEGVAEETHYHGKSKDQEVK